ncbi:hypothetical protein F7Q99_30620 [Streptomyces kaniharaensis]|uniref:Uncharacterized protein n=1 Tax=Streptomyces kaniharaensis TaxID=212423 RepID=A0A6N7KXR7_9ACTN|nr:hypothetical protein [Streptomyces kaniharaensis]MQS16432.1 hypothetical protein [Streptomyces kaniharaensis]
MTDETNKGRSQAPVVWALSVREAAEGQPVAELIVEVGARFHSDLLANAVDSGFVVAAGEPPATSGVVEVGGGRLERLVLVGGLQVWEPGSRVDVSPGWLAAAEGRGAVVVILVPPGTWPPGLIELAPQDPLDVFTQHLEHETAAGRVLHGMASLQVNPPPYD